MKHKTSLNKHEKIKIIPSVFSDHNVLKLKFNGKKKAGKKKKHQNVEIKQHDIKEQLAPEKIKGVIKRYIETDENNNTTYMPLSF